MGTVTIDLNGYLVTTDKSLMKLEDIHQWLSEEAYWCKGISYDRVKTAFDNSYCIGVIIDGKQIAYARLITDYVSFGYLADVFVTEPHRGNDLAKKMMEILLDLDWVKGLWRIMLSTTNAHELYRQFGFDSCRYPDRLMEVRPSELVKKS